MAKKGDIFAVISRRDVLQLVKKFRKHLEEMNVPVQKMYLFGSYGKGQPRYGSDIDVCVISSAFKDRLEANLFLRRETIKVDSRIEPVAYAPSQFEDWIPLVWEIKRTGVVVR